MSAITRRRFVTLTAIAAAGAGARAVAADRKGEPATDPSVGQPASASAPNAPTASDAAASPEALPGAPPAPVSPEFPTQAPVLAREMVGVSHANIDRVKELLAVHPTLANAAWDWGFGDWESALGAASHVGRPDIAKVLLDHGARPTIFSAAMLGQLAVVKAFVQASPGVQSIPGPHGIPLLAHARAGGDGAQRVVEYLVSIGGADAVSKTVDLAPEVLARYAGLYAFGLGETEKIEITIVKGGARFTRSGSSARVLNSLGDDAFHPVGAPRVRIRFVMEGDVAKELQVFDPELVLRARRIS